MDATDDKLIDETNPPDLESFPIEEVKINEHISNKEKKQIEEENQTEEDHLEEEEEEEEEEEKITNDDIEQRKMDQTILYYDSFSNFSLYLKEVFSDTNIRLIELESIEDIFKYTNNMPRLFVTDIPLDIGFENEFVDLNDYISCPKIYIFESFDEFNLHRNNLSKYNIFGLVKDNNLKERINSYLSLLDLLDAEDLYLEVDNINILSNFAMTSSVKKLDENQLTMSSPHIDELKPFDSAVMYLPHFQCRLEFSSEDAKIENDELHIKRENKDIIDQLKTFEFKSKVKQNIAYISDVPPTFQLFNKLDVKLQYYKSYDDYHGKEDIIIVEDKKITRKVSSGMEICKAYDKHIVILSRIFQVECYKRFDTDKVNAITSIFDLNAIKSLLANYKTLNPLVDVYFFDSKDNLSNAEIKTKCRINSINETYITIELPFRIEETTKVKIDFFGKTYLTVLESEGSGDFGFIVECRLDSLSENELNLIRQVINKMHYLVSKDVDLSQFTSFNEVLSFIYVEDSEVENQ